jgi:hypothetical protein
LYTCEEVITFLLDEFFVEVGDSFLPKSAIEVFRLEVTDEM